MRPICKALKHRLTNGEKARKDMSAKRDSQTVVVPELIALLRPKVSADEIRLPAIVRGRGLSGGRA